MRIIFEKGKQREFLNKVIEKTLSPSLRGLKQFGINVNYSTLKNYYTEDRTLPQDLFENLCFISRIDRNEVEYKLIDENWGKVIGGKKSKRK